MKTLKTAALLCALIISVMFFLAGSCTKSELPPYYIAFTMSGQESVFDLGVSGV